MWDLRGDHDLFHHEDILSRSIATLDLWILLRFKNFLLFLRSQNIWLKKGDATKFCKVSGIGDCYLKLPDWGRISYLLDIMPM